MFISANNEWAVWPLQSWFYEHDSVALGAWICSVMGRVQGHPSKAQAYTLFDRHSNACTCIKKHTSSYFQETKKSSQMAISSRNKMFHYLYIKGIYIISIEYFYYYIYSRTADSEKYTKVKGHGAIYYFHSSAGDSFSQYICKWNKIHMSNTSRY